MPIDKYESQIQHSLYGRKLGLDNAGFAVGVPGVRIPTETATTAGAATALTGHGLSVLTGSTAAYLLAAPLVAGIEKIIVNASTLSTATLSVVRSTALGDCSFLGTTSAGGIASTAPGLRINLVACGAAARLVSVSSACWAPVGYTGNITSSAYTYTVSTSS
jgi:hypothetical protein